MTVLDALLFWLVLWVIACVAVRGSEMAERYPVINGNEDWTPCDDGGGIGDRDE